ncbi:DC-STAMP domain-containing protein 2 [Lingula anatina]|uniref:DC-STAMP domain-containing protein 2 n=1 Tax=Lingula anatina TaxID=7574 RepID=A0A1S3IFY8_LINAN|nr:DC-STAMP domain-containing protein 2 [Lingula anatina]|eukprot:XP_013397132.1 DC-STAMP domain-containing protein 2 [Lingula anatina]
MNKLYKVVHPYHPEHDGDLRLQLGETLVDVTLLDNGWAMGRQHGTTTVGTFPYAYISPLQQDGSPQDVRAYVKMSHDSKAPKLPVKGSAKQIALKFGRQLSHSLPNLGSVQEHAGEVHLPLTGKKAITPQYPSGTSDYVSDDDMDGDTEPYLGPRMSIPNGLEKHSKSVSSLLLSKLSESAEVLNETKKKLFQSDRGEYKKLKSTCGAVCGVLLGVALFLGCHYGIGYDVITAAVISGISAIIMAAGFAASVHCRCIAALMIPNLCTGKGRAAILSVIMTLLLIGPVTNIFTNAQEASASMSCSADLAYNQSKVIQGLLKKPIEAVIDQMKMTAQTLQGIADQVRSGFSPVEDGLTVVKGGLTEGSEALGAAVQKCKELLNTAYTECNNGINKVYQDCRAKLSIASGVCEVVNVGQLCTPLNTNTVNRVCESPKVVDQAINIAIGKTKEALDDFQNFFVFDVAFGNILSASANTSKTVTDIHEAVKAEFKASTNWIMQVVHILGVLFSFSVLLLFFQSYFYLKQYLKKDKYDNIYITHKFKYLDEKRKTQGKETILPLKKREKKYLTDTTSLWFSPAEKSQLFVGLVSVLIHAIMAGTVCFFDYALYWLLSVISKHGNVDFEVSGKQEVNFSIEGHGILAHFFRTFIQGFQSNNNYNSSVSTTVCLPEASAPKLGIDIAILVIYIIAILLVFLQAYALRIRHKIVAYFYPERELSRIIYLYNQTMHKRKGILKALADKLKRDNKTDISKKNISITETLAVKIPCLKTIFQVTGVKKTLCISCATGEARGDMYKCPTVRCPGVYCRECYVDLKQGCPICDKMLIADEVVHPDDLEIVVSP